MNWLRFLRKSLFVVLAILFSPNTAAGQKFVPLPQSVILSPFNLSPQTEIGHHCTLLTPDSRHLIATDIRQEKQGAIALVSILDLQTGELLFEKPLDKDTLAPIGMTSDGQWLIGGGFNMHPYSEGVRRDMSKTSLYYAPLAAYLDEQTQAQVHELDLTSILPLNANPHLRVFLQSTRDLRDGLVAVFYVVARDHTAAAEHTNHCLVFSTREHRIVTSSDLGGKAKRITDVANQHFERIKLVPVKHQPLNQVATTQNMIRQRIPLTYQAELQATRAFTAPGTNVIIAPNGRTFFAVGPNGAFVGDSVTRNVTYLKDARQLRMPRHHWREGIRVVFSEDSTRLAARPFRYQKEAYQSAYLLADTQAVVYDVKNGNKLATLDFSISESNPYHIDPMLRFSSDNRHLLTGASTQTRTMAPRTQRKYCGYTIWALQ